MRISDWSSDVCSSDVPDCTTEDIDVLGTVIRVYSPGHISVTGISSAAQKNNTDDIDCSEANTIQPTGGDKYACRVEVQVFRGQARTYRSEEHTSELQSLMRISYAVF